tara:strand:+ start:120 stop:1730 length:1611 start_codon:yes stop_codon:yes gene_type:complete
MGFFKIDTSKMNNRYGRGRSVEKARQVKTFDTPNKNRAPDVPKTEAKEGDVLSYFDDTKGKVLTSFDGGYQSSGTTNVSDMNRYDQGQFVTAMDASSSARVRTRGELHAARVKETMLSEADGSVNSTVTNKYFDYLADSTCDTSDGSHTITCDSTNILNGKIKIGMNVVGTGIPEHAVVKSIPSTTSFTIGTYIGEAFSTQPSAVSNVNATADGTNVTLYFYGTILYLDGSRGGDIGSHIMIDNGSGWYKNTISGIALPQTGDTPSNSTEVARGAISKIHLHFLSDDFAIRAGHGARSGETYGNVNRSDSSGFVRSIYGSSSENTGSYSPYTFFNSHIRWQNLGSGDNQASTHTVVLEVQTNNQLRIVEALSAPMQKIGSIKHMICTNQIIEYAHSSDNTVANELKNVRIPANAIITKVAARVINATNLNTHKVNIQLSETTGTAADASISSGTEILGAGVTNTDSTDSASATDIDLKQDNDVWICTDSVRVSSNTNYIYICNAGTGNGTTNPLGTGNSGNATIELYIEYFGKYDT